MQTPINRIYLWTGLAIVLTSIVFVLVNMSGKALPDKAPAVILSQAANEQDWVRGPKDAKLELIEYGDFQCPACRNYYGALAELKKELGENNFKIIFRHFPLSTIHKNAKAGAYAAEAAGKQGKFWEMHDKLFETQAEWSMLANPEDKLIEYAQQLSLKKDQFQKDMKSEEIKAKVDAQYAQGAAMSISSTPTFFLNGKQLPQPKDFDEFKSFFSKVLNP